MRDKKLQRKLYEISVLHHPVEIRSSIVDLILDLIGEDDKKCCCKGYRYRHCNNCVRDELRAELRAIVEGKEL